ncbi:ribonuclease H-like domain-containing protein, partial [Tanacetum coccineum]
VHKESISKQGRKFAKGESSVQGNPLFDEIPEDTVDHMETENAQDKGRTKDIVDEDKEIKEKILSTDKEEVSTDKEKVSTDKEKVSTDRPIVSTDGSKVSTDRQIEGTKEQVESTDGHKKGTEEEIATQATQTPTSTIFGDDETIAKVLLNMSQAKAVSKEKEKGVELKDVEETDRPRPTSTRSLLTLKHLPKIDPKDKGKKKIEEEDESESESNGIPKAEKKFKQLESDEEMARKIQEEWESEEERNRIAEEKATNEALIRNFDDIKARIEADRLLAEKLQEQEREQFTIEERAKSDEDFISIGSAEDERLIKRMNEKGVDSSKSEVIKEENKEEAKEENKEEESTRKRKLGTRKKMKSRKRRYIQNTSEDDSEKENDELRLHLTIAPDEEKEVDYEILDRKYPIKEWRTECLGTKPQDDKAEHLEEINQNVVIRSNGQKRYFSTLMRVLSIFDREDLNAVYQLVMDRYQGEIPEGFDKVLWGDLMVMFNPDDEDEFWNSQQDWNIVSWKLHSSSGVHTLVTETGLVIHMLVEKKYPLIKKVMVQMLKLKLESEEDSTMALELIRFIKKLLAEHKNWLVHKQTACGKDFSNPFMVDNLPKIVGFSTHLASVVKSWLVFQCTMLWHEAWLVQKHELTIPEQTATGKGTSNPLMAGSLPKTTKPTYTDGSKVSTDRQVEGTDEQNKGTEEQIESTDGQRKGTEDHTKEGSATQATQTPTSTIFGDDETIAKITSILQLVSRAMEWIGKVAYKLEILYDSQIHNVFHVSQLKKCRHPSPNQVCGNLPPCDNIGAFLMEPVAVLDRRMARKGNVVEVYVLVQWANGTNEDATWESVTDLQAKFLNFDCTA